eukprot:scaffold1612_cov137-Isochrysis_galbana.AAC.1
MVAFFPTPLGRGGVWGLVWAVMKHATVRPRFCEPKIEKAVPRCTPRAGLAYNALNQSARARARANPHTKPGPNTYHMHLTRESVRTLVTGGDVAARPAFLGSGSLAAPALELARTSTRDIGGGQRNP